MKKKVLPLPKVYTLIEPGPLMLLTTAEKGRPNVMPLAWHTMMDFEPPLVGIVISEQNYSYKALLKTKACVLNIPAEELGKTVTACGNVSGRDTDKFAAFGLTPRPASLVAAPLIDECFASFECTVVDTRMARRYNFVVLKVLKAWLDPSAKNPKTLHHRGGKAFMVAGPTIQLPSKMK
jgi:flavin reductase (DIM6/NTAB) family NADH-FMN oxidoreductase RutF